MSDLKPCPFCGEKPIEYIQTGLVICSYFRCGVNPECKSKEDWNMRAAGWISVDDRLPEVGCEVQCWIEDQVEPLYAAYFDKAYFKENYGDEDYMDEGFYPSYCFMFDLPGFWLSVTHWMPIPEPPKQ